MSPELTHLFSMVVGEVAARYGSGYTAIDVKDHLRDRWPWFAPFGIEGRMDMDKVTVTFDDGPDPQAHAFHESWAVKPSDRELTTARTTISVAGTKLEGK